MNIKIKTLMNVVLITMLMVLHNSHAEIFLNRFNSNHKNISLGRFESWIEVPDELFKKISEANSDIIIKVVDNNGIELKPVLKGKVIRSMSVSPSDQLRVYAGLKGEQLGDGKIMVSNNNTKNWTPLNENNPLSKTATDVQAVVESPHDSNIIYAGTWKNGFYKSSDKGKHFERIEKFPSPDIRSIVFHKTNKNLILVATTSHGIVCSYDAGKTWETKSKEFLKGNFQVTWKLIQSPYNKNTVYALTYGGVFVSDDFSQSWEKIINEAGVIFTAITFKNESTIYVSNNHSTVYESNNGGEHFKKYTNNINGFINDIVIINGKVIFAGDKSLYYLKGEELVPSTINVPFPTISQFILKDKELLIATWGNGLIKKNISSL